MENLKQVDILRLAEPYCKKYGIKLNKNDLSQYVSGKVEPGQHKLFILALALNVNEAWLMGFDDVPMDPVSRSTVEDQKNIFSQNLLHYLKINNKTQADLVTDLGLTASTVSDWVNAKKYPRVDKMQMLADYFGILKSDLTEEHQESKLTDDIELQEYLEELKNREEMRMLFNLTKNATKEDVMQAVKIIEALKKD